LTNKNVALNESYVMYIQLQFHLILTLQVCSTLKRRQEILAIF